MLTLRGKLIAEGSLPSSKQDSSEKAGVSSSQAIKVNGGSLYKDGRSWTPPVSLVPAQ